MSLGNQIREVRKNNNLTQEQFAQKLHVTRQTVSNWENEKNYPDLSSLKIISEEYEVSFDELFNKNLSKKSPILYSLLIKSQEEIEIILK